MSARVGKARVQEARPQESPRAEDIQQWIAEAAYYRAERRGFQPGMEAEDWLAAEAQIQAQMRGGKGLI